MSDKFHDPISKLQAIAFNAGRIEPFIEREILLWIADHVETFRVDALSDRANDKKYAKHLEDSMFRKMMDGLIQGAATSYVTEHLTYSSIRKEIKVLVPTPKHSK